MVLEGRDHVDAVAVVERAGEGLVDVALHLEGADVALQVGADAPLGDGAEPPRRHLLAFKRRLGGDQAADLVGAGDCARDDAAPRNLERRQHPGRLGPCRAFSDVLLGNEHRHVVLAALDVPLVARHVEAREEGGHSRESDRDHDVSCSICHCSLSLSCGSVDELDGPGAEVGWPVALVTAMPVQTTSVNQPVMLPVTAVLGVSRSGGSRPSRSRGTARSPRSRSACRRPGRAARSRCAGRARSAICEEFHFAPGSE